MGWIVKSNVIVQWKFKSENESLDHNESNLDSAFVSGSCTAQNSDS